LAWLEQQAQAAGVDARFHGFITDLRDRLADLDVLVQPSRADNLPLAILEAMAAGLPVVGTRVGGIPELVADGETGFVVDAESPTALAEALERVAESPGPRLELGRRGRERVNEHFSSAGVARRMVELYEGLCASST
jgi:glycosyltransferase involved in cell wall biosynthesis